MKEIQIDTYKTKSYEYVTIHFEISKKDITEKAFAEICNDALKYSGLYHYIVYVFENENNKYHIAFTIDTSCTAKVSTGCAGAKYKKQFMLMTVKAINTIICNRLQGWINCKIIDKED